MVTPLTHNIWGLCFSIVRTSEGVGLPGTSVHVDVSGGAWGGHVEPGGVWPGGVPRGPVMISGFMEGEGRAHRTFF